MMKEKTRKERINYQLDQWVKGNPIHNDVDDECCPDFSCCTPELLQPKETRMVFQAAFKKGDNDTVMGMLMQFLGGMVSKKIPNKNINITDGNVSIKKDLN